MVIISRNNGRTALNQNGVTAFLAWGQSFIGAPPQSPPDTEVHPYEAAGYQIEGCEIWDKEGSPLAEADTLVDTGNSDTPWQFRPMEPGYSSSGDRPWVAPPTDPSRTWDLAFAYNYRQWTGERVRMVRFGPGGSHFWDRGNNEPLWNVSELGNSRSYLDILMETYWAPALAAMVAEVGGNRNLVKFGGVICQLGISDTGDDEAAELYQSNLQAAYDYITAIISPSDPTRVPWLQILSPVSSTLNQERIATVRAGQKAFAAANANVTWIDSQNHARGADNFHWGGKGNRQMGTGVFRWAFQQEGFPAPQGD